MKHPEIIEEFVMLPTVLKDIVINGYPSVDEVLDIRLEMSKLKDSNVDEAVKNFYESEITACDIVLRVMQYLQDGYEL